MLSRILEKRSRQPARSSKQRFREPVWQVLSSRLEGDISEGRVKQLRGEGECSWDRRLQERPRKPTPPPQCRELLYLVPPAAKQVLSSTFPALRSGSNPAGAEAHTALAAALAAEEGELMEIASPRLSQGSPTPARCSCKRRCKYSLKAGLLGESG